MGRLKDEAAKRRRIPYAERDDLSKLKAQWRKHKGLAVRDEPSAAIVRSATAAEVATNYAIRHLWGERTQFSSWAIDGFLIDARGLNNKFAKLFMPVQFGPRGAIQRRKGSPDLRRG